jgi:hypothetical protein
MSKLDDKIPEVVSAADLDSLIGRAENQRLADAFSAMSAA